MFSKRFIIGILYVCALVFSFTVYQEQLDHPVMEDKGRLLPVRLKSVESGQTENELKKIVTDATEMEEPISIAGMQHSQGGHTLYPDGIMLDMKGYKEILDLDVEKKQITVQSGATWADIQAYINPYGLSLKVSQSQNIFTVGGSLSVNGHGLDIRNGSLIDTVVSFRLLDAEGIVRQVSRTENAELFPLVLGGYGLFGVILDATLQLTDDELYAIYTESMNYKEYSSYFKENVAGNRQVKMHRARISLAPENFLTDMYVTDYRTAENQARLEDFTQLKRESIIALPKFFLGLARLNNWGETVFWETQERYNDQLNGTLISRNNVMRSDSLFMEYENAHKTEVLQEYFVPVDSYADYIDDLRKVLKKEPDFGLLNITVRYVEENEEAVLSYAKDDVFGLVMLINQGTDKKSRETADKVIEEMIDVTLQHGGSYYLPYYHFPTRQQLMEAYPRTEEFFSKKKKYDSEGRFKNLFYEEYRQ